MNWFQRSLGFIMQGTTQSRSVPAGINLSSTQGSTSTADRPDGTELAALAIKSNTLNYVFEDSKSDVDYVKGTVSACLNALASERGVMKFLVRERGIETIRSKQIQRVLNRPNPLQCRVEFMEECSQFYDATGNAILLFIKGDMGLPAEVYCLPAFYCVALFDKPEDVIPMAYRWADGRVVANNGSLCFVRNTSFKTAPYIGRGALGDALDTMQIYDFIITAQKNWFQTGGAPNVALTQPAGSILSADQISDMQRMWHDKYNPSNGTSNVAVLPDGVTPVNFGPNEMDFNKSKDETRDSIREYFQVPKVILGDTDNVNHNNGQTSLAMFERLKVLRWGQKFADALQCYFQREYSIHFTCEIDPSILTGFTELPTPRGNVQMPKEFQFEKTENDENPHDPGVLRDRTSTRTADQILQQ